MLGALHVVGVDVDGDALRVAQQNAEEYEEPLPVGWQALLVCGRACACVCVCVCVCWCGPPPDYIPVPLLSTASPRPLPAATLPTACPAPHR